MTLAQQAETWFRERRDQLLRRFPKVRIGSTQSEHPGGEVGIGVETPVVIANISIFNSGLITIPAVNKSSGKEFVLDHRKLAPDEDLGILLDRYVQQVESM